MFFQSWDFAAFFVAVYGIYLLVRKSNALTLAWLLAASYFFYSCCNPWYLALLSFCTLLDWSMGMLLGRSPRKKLWLVLSLAGNLGSLAFFKYSDFATSNLNVLLAWMGAGAVIPNPAQQAMQGLGLTYAFPLGISFFTFRSISYTIDVYRGEIPVERSLLRYAVFVSLFPQLAMGPIDRAGSLVPQLHGTRPIALADVTDGLSDFLAGFFKKAALADTLALYVDKVYGNPDQYQSPALLLATFAFSWQIYFDFSGYTDMARGIARMMGFRLTLNFNNPYTATGLGEFWNRWHISLSTWFKDYVYIPLGGNRGTKFQTYRNMILTMVISGVWHGPAWGFILWGALHALGRVVTRELERTAFYRDRVPQFVKQIGTFAFVTFAWIFFRCESWEKSWLVLSGIFASGWGDPRFPVLMLLMILAPWTYQFLHEGGPRTRSWLERTPVRLGLAAAMLAYLMVFAQGAQKFIYQQF